MTDKKIGKSKFIVYSTSEDTMSDSSHNNLGSSEADTDDLEKDEYSDASFYVQIHP